MTEIKKNLQANERAVEVGGSELPPARVDNAGGKDNKGKRRRGKSFTQLFNEGAVKSIYDLE